MTTQRTWAGLFGKIGGAGYDYGVQHEWIARPVGTLMWGTDTRLLFETIRTIGELPDGAAVLDVPCGGGLALRGVRPDQRLRYVAADISPDMLERARGRAASLGLGEVEFTVADIERMPFSDGEFDACLTFNGLHCLPDPAAAIREIARCLKPGGRLIGDTLVRGNGQRQDVLLRVFRSAGIFGPGGTAEDIQRWLDEAGLQIDRFETSGAVAYFSATRSTAPAG